QNAVRIDNLFESAMESARNFGGRLRPPAFFGETNPVLAGNYPTPLQHLREKLVKRAIDSFAHGCVAIETVCHDVDVNVAVTGVTEASDRKSMFRLKSFRKLDK